MKAIYINLDPYLAAFAAWLKANPADPDTGERATPPPAFDPLPLAVTVPMGQSVGIIVPGGNIVGGILALSTYSVDGILISVSLDPNEATMPDPPAGESVVTNDFGPGYTSYPHENTVNSVFSVSGDSAALTVYFFDEDDASLGAITLTVLVRREQASGPVDLVDFTPPAAAIAAGTDLKGCTFDGNAIEAAADTGVLSAPAAGG
jgi:hypothetical protein